LYPQYAGRSLRSEPVERIRDDYENHESIEQFVWPIRDSVC
jgi:hypothetical protein